MSNTLFSSMAFADYHSDSFHEVRRLTRTVDAVNIFSDYFPILRWFDPQGIRCRSGEYFEKFFMIFDDVIGNTLSSSPKKNDFLEALTDLGKRGDCYLSRKEIKHLLLVDLVMAGVDSTATVVEWTMIELLRNPDVMSKAKDELATVMVTNDKHVEESDLPRLVYLNAVVKETPRIHPPRQFLVPHRAEFDVQIDGFTIPRGASILFNVWAIGRDPFSSGRRMCPGLPLAHAVVHLMVANLIRRFDRKIGGEMRSKSLDVAEKSGLVLRKSTPLMEFLSIADRCRTMIG